MADKYPSKTTKTKEHNFKKLGTITSRFTPKDRKPAVPSSNDSVYNSSAEASVRHKSIKETIKSRFTSKDRKPAVPSSNDSVYNSSAEASIRHQSGATASVYNSSNFELCCDPCSTDGDHITAVGYCSVCCEYYCKTCYRTHARSKATKDHTLLDESKMPTITTTAVTTSMASMNIQPTTGTDDSKCLDEFKYKRDINVKHPNDENDCVITGMVAISDRETVIIDFENYSIKIIDVIDDVINSYMKFYSEPFTVTAVPNNEVAVTFPAEHLIRILTTTGGLAVKRVLKVNGKCGEVEYYNDKLYVSYGDPVKFQILSLSGSVQRTIQPDEQFLEHCTEPGFIAIHPDEGRVYVTDWVNHVVMCMDMNGTTLALYKDKGLHALRDITFTPFGSLYLCNAGFHNVYKIAEDLSEVSVILDEQDGIYGPGTMCFCPGRRSLYISSASDDPEYCNFIKQFE